MPAPKDSKQPHEPGTARRTRRPRGSLSRDVILDAAEAVAADGFGALSMRSVAASLGAVPMALYNHFATKDELVDALLDRVLSRFAAPPETADWRADLRAFAIAHRQVLTDHPWAVAPLFSSPSPGLAATRIGELALAVLERGGITGTRRRRRLQRDDRAELRLVVRSWSPPRPISGPCWRRYRPASSRAPWRWRERSPATEAPSTTTTCSARS